MFLKDISTGWVTVNLTMSLPNTKKKKCGTPCLYDMVSKYMKLKWAFLKKKKKNWDPIQEW